MFVWVWQNMALCLALKAGASAQAGLFNQREAGSDRDSRGIPSEVKPTAWLQFTTSSFWGWFYLNA